MNVLMVASECVPLVKTGGLADVVGALPAALLAEGCATRVMLPLYGAVAEAIGTAGEPIDTIDDLFGGPARLVAARLAGLDLVLIDAPHLYARPGNPYLGPAGLDWPDNHLRFAGSASPPPASPRRRRTAGGRTSSTATTGRPA